MILYSLDEFYNWLVQQHAESKILLKDYVSLVNLHDICVRFKEECDDQQTALEHSMAYRVAQDKERAAAHAARESAARKCAADAVAAEMEAVKRTD